MAEYKAVAFKSASLTDVEVASYKRYDMTDMDITFDLKYCGICHTDVHFINNDLGMTQYPLTPGHELIGTVTSVGAKVTKFKVGDDIGVGCMVDACLDCSYCNTDEEQYCLKGNTFTYGGVTTHGRAGPNGLPTVGGYSDKMTVHEKFAVKIPAGQDLSACAPLLCAGITMYEPLAYHKVGPGKKVGVVGMGGLGMMGIKLAKAFGAEVTAISTSAGKEASCKKEGADHFVISSDADAMGKIAGSLDYILDTATVPHDLVALQGSLANDGKLVLIGLNTAPAPIAIPPMLFGRRVVTSSLIGGIKRTQEMMDFCCEKKLMPTVDVIPATKVPEALAQLQEKLPEVKRFVIDCSTIASATF